MSEIDYCAGPYFTCGGRDTRVVGTQQQSTLTQNLNCNRSFMLGGTEIVVARRTRSFSLSRLKNYSVEGAFLLVPPNSPEPMLCGNYNPQDSGTINESYHYTTTRLYHLDTRHNSAIGEEWQESVTFTKFSNETAGFKETWGVFYYLKFHIDAVTRQVIKRFFVVVNGVKTILDTKEETDLLHGPDNPLIIVWPNPPSLAIPWINCEDIKKYGFYDYHAGGGQEKIQEDGGDDFYFTDWMRTIGQINRGADQWDASQRYFTYYLGDPPPSTQAYNNPGIFIDSSPVGSITKDPEGNVFYSAMLNNKTFNFLTDGDLAALFPDFTTKARFYPVGLI